MKTLLLDIIPWTISTDGTIKTSTADLTTFKHWKHNVKEIFFWALPQKPGLTWLLGMVEAEPAGGRAIQAIPFPQAFLGYIIIVRITCIIFIWITLTSSQTSVQANAGAASCILTHCNLIIVVFRRGDWEENSNNKCNWTEEQLPGEGIGFSLLDMSKKARTTFGFGFLNWTRWFFQFYNST